MKIKNVLLADMSFVEGNVILPLIKIPVFKEFGIYRYSSGVLKMENYIGMADNFRIDKNFIICDIEIFDKAVNPLALQVSCSVKIDNETK